MGDNGGEAVCSRKLVISSPTPTLFLSNIFSRMEVCGGVIIRGGGLGFLSYASSLTGAEEAMLCE